MDPAFLVRLRPAGPWRIGPASGAKDQIDFIYHSDTLYSAVSGAMAQLGLLQDWLAATAEAVDGPAVRFTSMFPFIGDALYVPPPRSVWPPALSPKVRWTSARFVPISVAADLLAERPVSEDRWVVDGMSGCLLPHDGRVRPGPVRPARRSFGAVDRLTGIVEPHSTACLEFAEGAGWWAAVTFSSPDSRERWSEHVKGAFRLLADTGFGGNRSLGWGHAHAPEFTDGTFPELIGGAPAAPESEEAAAHPQESGWWLLSLFSPAAQDAVEWSRGSYSLATRGGRIESPARSGEHKRIVQMVEEGSVILSSTPPRGAAPNVAPEGFPHPVFRAGFAVAAPVPLRLADRPTTSL